MDRAWCVQLALVGGQLLAKGTSNRSNFQGANKELRPSRELLVVGTVHGQIAKVTGQDLSKWQPKCEMVVTSHYLNLWMEETDCAHTHTRSESP